MPVPESPVMESPTHTLRQLLELVPPEEAPYVRTHFERFLLLVDLVGKWAPASAEIANIGLSPFDVLAKEIRGWSNYFNVVSGPLMRLGGTKPYSHLNLIEYDLTSAQSEPPRQFDFVIFSEVLEHLFADDELVMHQVGRLIRSGGRLLITVPNAACHRNRLRLLRGINIHSSKSDIVQGVYGGHGHVREYTLSELKGLLQKDFDTEELFGFNTYGTPLQRKILNTLPDSFAFTLVAIARRTDGHLPRRARQE